MNKKNTDMTEGPITPALISFTMPILFGNLFQQFYNIADTIIVGRTLGANALAAVGATGTINFLVLGFATGLTQGFAVVTSQKFGARDQEGMRRTVFVGCLLMLYIGAVLTVVSFLGMKPLLRVMNTPDNIFADSYAYISVICLGTLATVYYNLFSCYLRAIGNSRVPLLLLIFSSALNIVLDLLFILAFGWGVAGAAIATVTSQFISAILCGIYIVRRETALVPRKGEWRISRDIARAQLYIGLPMALQYAITSSGTIVMQAAVNLFGSLAVAAFAAAGKCAMLFTTTYMSIGQSMATFSGQNYGKGDISRIKKGVNTAVVISSIYSVVAGILACVLLPWEISLFFSGEGDLATLLPYARIYMLEAASCFIPLGFIFIFRNTMQGYGSAFWAMAAGIVEMISRFVLAGIAMKVMSYPLAVAGDPLTWLITGIYTAAAFAYTSRRIGKRA